ncbi:MAG: 16S rRNA (adenine(1518)-N(6)/adenine(1519)-N(6))-dimethyltransferase RsmA [Candidatus Hadarchaeota archaeon]
MKLDKDQGQSQLVDEAILDDILQYGDLDGSEVVLEVGAGIGNLTIKLCKDAQRVVAIEKDPELFEVLKSRTAGIRNLRARRADVMEIDLPDFDKVISNLPYSISSPVTFKILREGFSEGVLMYQREFAKRMVASPDTDNYGRLSVSVYYRAKCKLLRDVPPQCFIPEPEVWSSLVKLVPRDPPFEVEDEGLFFRVVKASFQHRRQKLRNALCNSFSLIKKDEDFEGDERNFIDEVLPEEFLHTRPAKITPEEYAEISNILSEAL